MDIGLKKESLSVCLITHNEGGNLEECLESISGLADEIVIVDSESTDETGKIAQKYRARFITHPFDDFGKQKQRAIDLATNSWILLIDADERLTAELFREIQELLRDSVRLEQYPAYLINRVNFFMGRAITHGGWSPDFLIRLFRKDSGRLSASLVHESVLTRDSPGKLKGNLNHFTYTTIDSFLVKNARYARLSALEKKSRGQTPSILKVLFDPPFVFVRMYVFQQGFRDGKEGLFLAILYSFHTALKYLWMYYL